VTEKVSTQVPPPPTDLVQWIGGSLDIGPHHVSELRRFADLQPHEKVLDVGSGIGRTALPLMSFLSADGRYAGFDVIADCVDWCNREIAARDDRFRFDHVDLYNGFYNPEGSLQPTAYRFPYEDDEFDLVFLFSVFTHLLPDALEHYTSEVARVLKPGGRMLATLFLLDDARIASLRAAAAAQPESIATTLVDTSSDAAVFATGYEVPELMVAYKEGYVRAMLRRAGLPGSISITPGKWLGWACGEEEVMGPQDTLVAYS
jgi:SAM-dependent methyltransferase